MRKSFENELLLITPHTQAFIGDQLALIKEHFRNVDVLLPLPIFSKLVIRLPYLSERYAYLKRALYSSSSRQIDNVRLIPVSFLSLPVKTIEKMNYNFVSRRCMRFLKKDRTRFSLIHSHFLDVHSYIGAMVKDKFGKPLIVTAHGGDVYHSPFASKWTHTLARFVLSKADRIITVCKYNTEKLLSLGANPKKIVVIPNGYNAKLFRHIPSCWARSRLGLPVLSRVLLSVGNLVDVKGHTYLLDAMQAIARKRRDVILAVVGAGSLGASLQRKTRKLGLSGKILFAGMRRHEEIPIWMNACDLLVLPSLNEGFPSVIPEAMACAKPVIGTEVGGVPEIITNPDVGTLVSRGNSKELAFAILEGLDKAWDSQAILNHAQQYSWSLLVPKILSVYYSLLPRQQALGVRQ